MDAALVERLCCPACAGDLVWTIEERDGDRIERGAADCRGCGSRYPVASGVASFLVDAPGDAWEEAESGLARHLAEHPAVERQLLDGPVGSLGPADAFFRAFILEERGDYDAARAAAEHAHAGLYTAGFRDCAERQLRYVVEQATGLDGPAVDIASGRCTLVERLARAGAQVVATDVSPAVLVRSRRRLDAAGVRERISFLAFDARRTPFRDGAARTLTSHLGLANVEEPGPLLTELRRIASDRLLAVSHFYPEDDEENRAALREYRLEAFLVREPALAAFAEAGWRAEVANACVAEAEPTPAGEVIEGAQIDGLPVTPTLLEWCVLQAIANER